MIKKIVYFGMFTILIAGNLIFGETGTKAVVKTVTPKIVAIFNHDPSAFTQGLEFKNGKLYESTGLYGSSSLRVLDSTGKIQKNTPIAEVFAEGCTILKNQLYQITWKEMQCLVYSYPDLTIKKVLPYSGEGWGLTNDTKRIIMSNGSDTLYFRDSLFNITKKIAVRLNGRPLENLNELDFARKKVFANVWFNNSIYEIDTLSGNVSKVIDCSSIIEKEHPGSDQAVLNGIAYEAPRDLFYITGKNWKHLYLVEIPK